MVTIDVTLQRRARPIEGYTVEREYLERLDPLRRICAENAIRSGKWKLIDSLPGGVDK